MAARRAKAKKTETRETVVSVSISENLEFGCGRPTQESWDRYMQGLANGNELAARRGVILANCTTHSTVGGADHSPAEKILNRFPVLAAKLSDAMDSVAGGDLEPDVDVPEGLVSFDLGAESFVLNGPDMAKWEEFQTNTGQRGAKLGPVMRQLAGDLCDNKAALMSALETYPAAIGPIIGAVGSVAGADFEVKVKKG